MSSKDNDRLNLFQWHQLPIKFGADLRFPSKNEFPSPFDQIPISIKIADYDLDGYPDMVAVMKDKYISSINRRLNFPSQSETSFISNTDK